MAELDRIGMKPYAAQGVAPPGTIFQVSLDRHPCGRKLGTDLVCTSRFRDDLEKQVPLTRSEQFPGQDRFFPVRTAFPDFLAFKCSCLVVLGIETYQVLEPSAFADIGRLLDDGKIALPYLPCSELRGERCMGCPVKRKQDAARNGLVYPVDRFKEGSG